MATVAIPSRHAINQAFRAIWTAADVNGTPAHWLFRFQDQVVRGRLRIDDLESDIRSGPTAPAMTGMTRTDGRRLGRPAATFRIGRLTPDRFLSHDPMLGWGHETQVLVLRRETVEVAANRLEERSTPSGLVITRHVLERLYEREHCGHDEIHRRILDDLAAADGALALAVASGLFIGGPALGWHAHTMIPMGAGLLFVQNVAIAMRRNDNPVSRQGVERHGVLTLPVARDPRRMVELAPMEGMSVDGHCLAMAMTYVSDELLTIEQRAYAALFRREAERHDLADLAHAAGRAWLPHERVPPHPVAEVDPRLRYLLGVISRPRPRSRSCLSMGWTYTRDPRPQQAKAA